MHKDNLYAVIMAGGKGERFWPQSRMSHPKQLLRLIGNLTLIEQTVERLSPLLSPQNIFIITNADYVAPMKSLLPSLPKENIVGESVGRDTAPCVALATAMVKARAKSDKAIMIVLPSDHSIGNSEALLETISDTIPFAEEGKLVTIGIPPSGPSTGYGYIHCGPVISSKGAVKFHECLGFKEKPSLEKAEELLREGCYKWNSGIFIWSVAAISKAFELHAPALAKAIPLIQKAAEQGKLVDLLQSEYEKLERISIDYAVMEKADNIVVAEASFPWDDVGSWTALRNQIRPEQNNNVVRGLHVGIDSKNCIVVGDATHLIATIDVDDLVIVHTDDATLVCNARSAQRVKEMVKLISSHPELSSFV